MMRVVMVAGELAGLGVGAAIGGGVVALLLIPGWIARLVKRARP